MMNHIHDSTSPEESRRFPVKTVLVAVVILAAVAAVLVFDVPVFTVLTYGFLGLMLFSHLFMHGSHSSHDHSASNSQPDNENSHIGPADPGTSQINPQDHAGGLVRQTDPEAKAKKDQDTHQGHSGGC